MFSFLIAVSCSTATAQPFADEIAAFKKQDSISFPGTGKILFVGSSSFRMWKDVADYFPGYPIINCGFGGSTLPDVVRYANDIIFPYQPKQIVIYCGENDIATDSTVTDKTVFKRFKTLYHMIRKAFRVVPVVYISIKPSPSRWSMRSRMTEANRLIKNFLDNKKRHAQFVDVWSAMLGAESLPREDIFIEDRLHMNAKGYRIWKNIIEPYLLKK
ncbi:MAG: G-D-S-L family lipolytic protein [Sphingobacteriales bacterium]|nr:G-D-S-L family lipolytic protein [Sphingobacteriales bacterium]